MRAIFAVGDAATAKRLLAGHWALVSFAYVGTNWVSERDLDELATGVAGLVFDSGAFTEWQRTLEGKPSKGISVESYTEWLATEAPPFNWALVLDVIANAEASVRNWRLMQQLAPSIAAKIVPVWHEGDPIEHLDEYVGRAACVGLGRTDGRRSEKKTREFYDAAFNRWPEARFHALGNGNPTTLEPYPFESFDSTAWQRDSTYAESHGWPWSRVTKETRMRAYIEAAETIRHRPRAPERQLQLFGEAAPLSGCLSALNHE